MNKFEQWIGNYPDFPKKGILFRDISPLLASPEGMSLLKKEFLKLIADWKPDLIAVSYTHLTLPTKRIV